MSDTARAVIGGLIEKQGTYLLLCHTKHGCKMGLPGGKASDDESHVDTLQREIREELGVEIPVHGLVCQTAIQTPEGAFMAFNYKARITEGVPTILEPEKIAYMAWFSIDELLRFRHHTQGPSLMVPSLPTVIDTLQKQHEKP